MNKNRLWLVAALIVGLGGYWAYDAYQENKRMEAWDALLSNSGCDSCTARKKAQGEAREARKAEEEGKQAE